MFLLHRGRSAARSATVVACLVLPAMPTLASAVTVTVTSCASDADFRAKLAQLQAGSGGTLKFACGASPPPIVLGQGDLPLQKPTIIDGTGGIVLSGGNALRFFVVDPGVKVTLRNLTLTRGFRMNENGGAIVNSGNLTIEGCRLTENQSQNASGGAILSLGKLTIVDSELDHNTGANGGAIYSRFSGADTKIVRSSLHHNETTSTTDGWGGAILAWDGAEVTISSSMFADNRARQGGAFYVLGATSTLTSRSTVWTRNEATVTNGGAISNFGTVDLTGDTLTANTAFEDGGAIHNANDVSLTDTTLAGNETRLEGGALKNAGVAVALRTTFSGNRATKESDGIGGAINNEGMLELTNVTLSGNTASRFGGALYIMGAAGAVVVNSTFYGNAATFSAASIHATSGEVRVKNTILGGSLGGPECNAFPGPFVTEGFNVVADASCFAGPTDQVPASPLLGPLSFNGGRTKTHMPQALSPAVDNGTGNECPATDQRLTARPQGLGCDVGAVERCTSNQPSAFALAAPANGGKVKNDEPNLDWTDATCAETYKVTVKSGSSAGPVVFTDKKLRGSEVRLPPLPNGLYWWQVKACARRCRTSEGWTFRIKQR